MISMINIDKVAQRINTLRKEKGLTQEALAAILDVSPQAVSKWGNGKTLPETSILPLLAKTLGASIDSILVPQELQILSAVYTDGETSIDVTRHINRFIIGNELKITVNQQVIGSTLRSRRIKYLIIKYQVPDGVYFIYTRKDDNLSLDVNTKGYEGKPGALQFLSGFYGNENTCMDVMQKLAHYEFFRWNGFSANHELFPSPPDNDGEDFLTIVYLNESGIQVISCAENESLCFNRSRTVMSRQESNESSRIIENVRRLGFGKNMDCTWAGALYAALESIGEQTTYETVMGVSGACWRIAFCNNCWDYSSVDGLVAYDYATPGYRAFGYTPVWADRIEKKDRKTERQNIIDSIKNKRPPIAINLRVAPEWGVITGYLEEGKRLLCRAYFDDDIFDKTFPTEEEQLEFTEEMKKTKGYLYVDNWPFAIAHFSMKGDVPSALENFINSLKVKNESMQITENRGYKMGYAAYDAWIEGLLDSEWYSKADNESFIRRLSVNHFCMLALVDARRCAATYLEQSAGLFEGAEKDLVLEMLNIYSQIHTKLSGLFSELPDDRKIKGNEPGNMWTSELRERQAVLLRDVAALERRADKLSEEILINNMLIE